MKKKRTDKRKRQRRNDERNLPIDEARWQVGVNGQLLSLSITAGG